MYSADFFHLRIPIIWQFTEFLMYLNWCIKAWSSIIEKGTKQCYFDILINRIVDLNFNKTIILCFNKNSSRRNIVRQKSRPLLAYTNKG